MNNSLSLAAYRILHGLRGTDSYRFLGELEREQFLSEEALLALQRERLLRILDHARQHSPFYRHRIPRRLPTDRTPTEILASIPVLTKDEVRAHGSELRSQDPPCRVLRFSTSGSTGKPLQVYEDAESVARTFAAKWRALRWYGVQYTDRMASVWGRPLQPHRRVVQRLKDGINNRVRLGAFDLSPRAVDRFLKRLEAFQPAYINGYTSGIALVASRVLERGLSPARFGIRVVFVTGEVLHDLQREQIARAFDCPVVDEYGGCEVHCAAYTCPAGCLHPSHDNVIIELLNQGRPAAAGEFGSVVATCLWNKGMPLIRYENGDLGVWSTGSACSCGRFPGRPLLERVVGRTVDWIIRTDGMPIYASVLTYAVRSSGDPGQIAEWRAQQWRPGEVEIEFVRGPCFDPVVPAKLQQIVERQLGPGGTARVNEVAGIVREPSCKLRYFVSHLNDCGDDPAA